MKNIKYFLIYLSIVLLIIAVYGPGDAPPKDQFTDKVTKCRPGYAVELEDGNFLDCRDILWFMDSKYRHLDETGGYYIKSTVMGIVDPDEKY